MKKIIYVKQNTKNQKETFEITSMSLDFASHYISVNIRHVSYDPTGIPVVNDLNIYFNESYSVNIFDADPTWDEKSTPIPKPKDFVFSNPDTWGSITLADIPMVKRPASNTKMAELCAKAILSGKDFGYNVHKILFDFLIEQNKLPSGANWSFEDRDA